MATPTDSALQSFRERVALLERAGLPAGWGGPGVVDALAGAAASGADADILLEAAVRTGQEAADLARARRRPWFMPLLVCAGAALGAALLSAALEPVFGRAYAEFRVPAGPGLALLERARDALPLLAAAAAAALALAGWVALASRPRPRSGDAALTALGCETLAALDDAGVAPERARAAAGPLAAAVAASEEPLVRWAGGIDLGGVSRAFALRQAARMASASIERRLGETDWARRMIVAVLVAGAAVLAYALVLFLPAVDFLLALSDSTVSR